MRSPAVAGRFYPGGAAALAQEVREMMPVCSDTPAIAVVGPHAGYIYSGAILGETYARAQVPERVIIMCPNHTGRGTRSSLWAGGAWALPGGDVPIDEELTAQLAGRAGLELDADAHIGEHAIEVHLPFLRARRPDVKIVPICLSRLRLGECIELGETLAQLAKASGALIAASTDMSHYLSADEAKALDKLAIERVLALDPEGLHETVETLGISMCGYIPTTVALVAAKRLGATRAELVRYGNSGERSGDYNRVVGYAGFTVR